MVLARSLTVRTYLRFLLYQRTHTGTIPHPVEYAILMGTKVQHRREYAPIPRLLRQMRESVPITQQDLADQMKWHKSAVQKSEAGDRRVDFGEFVTWSRACGADPRQALEQYLQAMYPDDQTPVDSTIQWPWEVRDEPLKKRDEEVVGLLSKASSLLDAKGKKAQRKLKTKK